MSTIHAGAHALAHVLCFVPTVECHEAAIGPGLPALLQLHDQTAHKTNDNPHY